MNSLEKRSFIRVNVNQPIVFSLENNPVDKKQALALNISIDGIQILTDTALSPGENIIINLPNEWTTAPVAAIVLRSHANFIGCQFVNLNQVQRHQLDQLIYAMWRKSTNNQLSC